MPNSKDIIVTLDFESCYVVNRSEFTRLESNIRKLMEDDEHGREYPLVAPSPVSIYLSDRDFS